LTGAAEIGSVLVVAAHPDDDVIGAAGLLQHLGSRAHVVYVTDGSPSDVSWAKRAGFSSCEAYAAARLREAHAALALAGVAAEQTTTLGVTDQRVLLCLEEVATGVAEVAQRCNADAIVTHPYEGGHIDHDATALASYLATRRLAAPPKIVEFTSYHANGGKARLGEFLGDGLALTLQLNERCSTTKRAMLDCHRSQAAVIRDFGFGVDQERFRLAPDYDFERLPHDEILYESFLARMDGETWLSLVRPALQRLAGARY
jgi:LmbE family N-acetylglucosaminyl deacetylase